MQIVERSALVTYSPAQMFALVNDVACYPEFLPWCEAAGVKDVTETERIATVKVSRGVLKAEFTTRNLLTQDAEIRMQLLHGPFRDLKGLWRFEAIGTRGSRIQFRVEFEFKNRLTAGAFNTVFESLCGTIVDAFAQRAQKYMADESRIDVEVAYAEPRRAIVLRLSLAHGAMVSDALSAASQNPAFHAVDLANSNVGVFGKVARRDQALNAGDRIEIYRPLAVDPKAARRARSVRASKSARS